MPDIEAQGRMHDALNLVTKWRTIFAGRVWGTAPKTPQSKGRTDIFERLIILRIEQTALTKCMLDAGVLDHDKWIEAVTNEALLLNADYERDFPGLKATPDGMTMHLPEVVETMKGWPK